MLTGGDRHELGGTFFQPTVLADVTPAMVMAREETFGPVAPLFRFRDEADVIAQANATQYGLASYFYARDLGRVFRVAEALEYGMVCVNSGVLSTEVAPFGGVKQSGLGREGSRHGIEEFLELKYVLLGGLAEPIKAEPAKAEPAAEPATVETVKIEPVNAEPAKAERVSEPATVAEPVTAEPAKAEPPPVVKPPPSLPRAKPMPRLPRVTEVEWPLPSEPKDESD